MVSKRTPWVLLLAAILLLGAIDLHPAGEAHDSLVRGTGEVYFPSAKHPHQPAHWEGSEEAQRPVCPICLHNLQVSGAHLRPGPAVAPPAPRLAPACDLSSSTDGGTHRPSGARGPPSLS